MIAPGNICDPIYESGKDLLVIAHGNVNRKPPQSIYSLCLFTKCSQDSNFVESVK